MDEFKGIRRIGIDESGKGDYFGPLVIAAVLVEPEDEDYLGEAGVKDSKRLTDRSIERLAAVISGRCRYSVVRIGPSRYNSLYEKIRNLNRLLAWGHSRALENVLEKSQGCEIAISDQFGDESFLMNALMKGGRQLRLVQMPKAEQDIAVAAASIMARAEFVKSMETLSGEAGMKLPKGASDPNVAVTAKELLGRGGTEELAKYAKVHFKITRQVTEGLPAVKRGV
ncbi:MAG TPA: ribonuclease HIII [Bacillota bacterium]|nr:ribonuclease HIII [Bacillota bacterium]HOH10444.1 ribonuclease HIII [Bacillota bacterium]HOY88797.1 ribonuclease HIII [Bacillota bacterium]HPI01060.1 ribonuclease HIII [Bacillota bacterium]HPM63157.1 ribonuclease HIII [Bacillota bacterium]